MNFISVSSVFRYKAIKLIGDGCSKSILSCYDIKVGLFLAWFKIPILIPIIIVLSQKSQVML